jgi:anthranilate phosphoribosyltransferase
MINPAELLRALLAGQSLGRDKTRELFLEIMSGTLEPAALGGILVALAAKGESADELVGAAEAMRAHVTPISVPDGVDPIDTCGTGGDGKPTFNVSSAVAIVAAAAGLTVAKHGNRSTTRPSGSAEGLAALGINVEADPETVSRCLDEVGVGFLYAVKLHPAMKHAGPVRKALGVRTIFNLIGPITNPAGVRRQLLGVNRPELVPLMRSVLMELGAERVMVVHGEDGLCDLSLSGSSHVASYDGHASAEFSVSPGAVGVKPARLESLYVSSAAESAAVIERVLAGEDCPAGEMIVLNAGAALWVGGKVDEISAGVSLAREVLASGQAARVLDSWRAVSHGRSVG